MHARHRDLALLHRDEDIADQPLDRARDQQDDHHRDQPRDRLHNRHADLPQQAKDKGAHAVAERFGQRKLLERELEPEETQRDDRAHRQDLDDAADKLVDGAGPVELATAALLQVNVQRPLQGGAHAAAGAADAPDQSDQQRQAAQREQGTAQQIRPVELGPAGVDDGLEPRARLGGSRFHRQAIGGIEIALDQGEQHPVPKAEGHAADIAERTAQLAQRQPQFRLAQAVERGFGPLSAGGGARPAQGAAQRGNGAVHQPQFHRRGLGSGRGGRRRRGWRGRRRRRVPPSTEDADQSNGRQPEPCHLPPCVRHACPFVWT
ncbi:hypothetical protein D3C81_1078070 [compost metagenome]